MMTILCSRKPVLSNRGVSPWKSTVPRSYWLRSVMPSASNTVPIAPSRPRWAGSSATSTSTTCVTRPKLYPELAEGRALPRSSPHPRQACAVCQTSRCAANLALSRGALYSFMWGALAWVHSQCFQGQGHSPKARSKQRLHHAQAFHPP